MPFNIGDCSTSSWGIAEPWFFHRQHENDIKTPQKPTTVTDQCKRVALVTLPILSYTMYQILSEHNPLWQGLSLAMNGLRGLSSVSMLQKGLNTGNTSQIASAALQTSLSAASVAATVIAPPVGILISTAQDLTLNAGSIYRACEKGDMKKAYETGAKMALSSLYLGTFFYCSAGLWMAVSSAQILTSLYFSADELQKGNHLESGAHMLMALWRLPQLAITSFIYDQDMSYGCDDCDID